MFYCKLVSVDFAVKRLVVVGRASCVTGPTANARFAPAPLVPPFVQGTRIFCWVHRSAVIAVMQHLGGSGVLVVAHLGDAVGRDDVSSQLQPLQHDTIIDHDSCRC